jgi:methylated-DNA-[protein]-cysteine S-methyltransferase
MTLVTTVVASPIGPLRLTARGAALTGLYLPEGGDTPDLSAAVAAPRDRTLREVADQLDAYFAGERRSFDLALAPEGTPFQRLVWDQLLAIPFGVTMSYGELARRCGRPHGARAVGTANGRNPIAIIVPCHRVIGADGSLTGYGGGLPTKRWLLQHEGQRALFQVQDLPPAR